jgi:hypothetical protein
LKLLLLFALVSVVPLVAVGVLLIDVNADAVESCRSRSPATSPGPSKEKCGT